MKKCLKCGQCCKKLIIEASIEDGQREPKIAIMRPLTITRFNEKYGNEKIHDLTNCPFLTQNNLCEIHLTRPELCKQFLPGCPLCQYARGIIDLSFSTYMYDVYFKRVSAILQKEGLMEEI